MWPRKVCGLQRFIDHVAFAPDRRRGANTATEPDTYDYRATGTYLALSQRRNDADHVPDDD